MTANDVIHLYERECSLQRRRQKVWEEAPAACLTPDLREQLCASAVQLAKSVTIAAPGTLEYLYDEAAREFFFIEMNTRIQVEHPVTEMITGIDLVQEMIRIAGGEPLRFSQSECVIRGHAIEVRINAEDPAKDFMPAPGRVTTLACPAARACASTPCSIAGYDSAAVLRQPARQADRRAARPRPARSPGFARALGELIIEGVPTTGTCIWPAGRRDVKAGRVHTAGSKAGSPWEH